ncbi:MAG TPA: hypothetical protein VF950_16300 [Planctomycetota bacterium]
MVVLLLLALQDPDPRARAIREAYEEQLRRDRSEVRFHHSLSDERFVELAFERPEGLAAFSPQETTSFLRVWSQGDQAFPPLIERLARFDVQRSVGATRLLNQLSGRRAPMPDEFTCAGVKEDWEAWLARRPAALSPCAHADDDVRGLIDELGRDALEARVAAETALKPCASRHRKLLDAAIAATREVETLARLRALVVASESGFAPLTTSNAAALQISLALLDRGQPRDSVAAMLRAERERFLGAQRETLDLVIRSLER